ncbi:MAG: fumarate hydratase, partial [Defluviitaleaceae bacterium]|nr:fumarate hydratase [Defluviitaleaceae bacterium]
MAIREIHGAQITEAIAALCLSSNIDTNESVCDAICRAREIETSQPAKNALDMIIKNIEVAKTQRMPVCQDTGMVVVFMDIGQDVHITGNVEAAVNEGVRQSYRDGYFRASIVGDPIDRKNTKDNTPAVIHYNLVPGDRIKIDVMPKGFGSENKSALKMLTPSAGIEGIEDFVLDTVQAAGSSPCPPIIVGIGVGGTMEKAAILAKQAVGLDLLHVNESPYWGQVEARLLEKINRLNIGVAGFKGPTTAL